MNRPFDIAGEVDAELVTHILRAGAGGIYRRSVGNDTAIPYDVCMDLLERGIRIIRETEYRKGGVYETYEHSFAGQFTKV
jgi:hypothetical protein